MKNFFGLIVFPIAIAIVIIGLIGLQLKVFWEMVTKKDKEDIGKENK